MQNTLMMPASPALERTERVIPTIRLEDAAERLPLRAVRRILLPFDLSRAGVCALRIVTDFAEKNGATIHLLHVVPPSGSNGIEPNSNRVDDYLAEASERILKHWVKRVVQGRAKTFVSIRIGEPADLIVARAVATNSDLIVMTSRGSGSQNFELQRSIAERVSRIAPCPVLTIPEKCRDQIAYPSSFPGPAGRAILVPVDYSIAAEESLRFAAGIASETGATLLLAHGCVIDDGDEPFAHMRLKSWASRLLGDTIPCEVAIWPGGHSLYAILSEAVRSQASLIVLPTAAQSWARRLRAGSITDGVLRQAPCPVLSINERVSFTER